MAGDWIKLEHTTPDKPEVYAMAETLGIDPDAVLGKLCRLWIWADQQTYDGNARSVTRTLVDRVTGVTGFCDAACSAGWIVQVQDGLLLPNFERHNGQTAKSRALTAKRVSRHRENVTESKRNCNAQSVTGELPEKRREEKKRNKPTPASAGVCPDPQSGPADESPAGTGYIFATTAGAWELPARKLAEYEACYPFDVAAEMRKAAQWLRDNPARRKSKGGMPAFLTRWLNSEHDKRAGPSGKPHGRETNTESIERLKAMLNGGEQ